MERSCYSLLAIRLSLFRQQIAYLLEQHFLARRRRGLGFLVQAQPVHALDGEEQHAGDEDKINADGDEAAPGEHRALLLGVGERGGGHRFFQRQEVVGKIESADERPDQRHDHVADERIDDLAEGGADDDADGEIDDASLERETLEFLEHGILLPARPGFGGATRAALRVGLIYPIGPAAAAAIRAWPARRGWPQ